MKEGTPVPQEEVRGLIKSCLETAAHVNYKRLALEAKIGEDLDSEVCAPPSKKLEDLIHLAEICVDLLQQNDEHYSEVLVRFLELSVHCFGALEIRGPACWCFRTWVRVRFHLLRRLVDCYYVQIVY